MSSTKVVAIVPNDDDYASLVVDPMTSIDIPYAYTVLCDRLRHAFTIKEECQFLIGDILKDHETVYAERTIAGLAEDIGVSPSSLYTYRDMARLYPAHVREHYIGKGLYWSHLRLVLSLGSLDAAQGFLNLCALNHWSVARAAIELKALKGVYVPPLPVFSGVCHFRVEGGHVLIEGLQGVQMEAGVEYDVIIKVKR